MTYKNIIYEKKNLIAYLTLNRTDTNNVIDTAIAEELVDCCQSINQDDQIRVVIITGTGNAFSSGIDNL